jgi:hypothetical protein
MYVQSDVKYSFHTKFGETIDCVDFFAQPGVKALAAAGHPITQLPMPATQPSTQSSSKPSDDAFLGDPDDEGRPRACPATTVPILRITASDIGNSGGLDSFLNASTKKQGSAMTSRGNDMPPDSAGPGFAHTITQYSGGGNIVTGFSYLGVYDPNVQLANCEGLCAGDHSLSQTWLTGGSGNGLQTVELGWNVDPVLYASSNQFKTHLFIYSTTDGYQPNTAGAGCYNNKGSNCVPYVACPGAQYTAGQMLNSSTFGSQPIVMQFTTILTNGDCGTNGWRLQVNGFDVGVYPETDFTVIQNSAPVFQSGSEVFDETQTFSVPMGTGSTPGAGSTEAALYEGPNASNEACNENDGSGVGLSGNPNFNCTFTAPSSTVSNYAVSQDGSGDTYYGDVTNVWWGTNSGFQFTPIGDWASGSYKGECGNIAANSQTGGVAEGQPVVGLSASTSEANSHGVLCGQVGIQPTGTCYARALGSSDNRGDTDSGSNFNGHGGDWDYGFTKDECSAGEYVQGAAQGSGSNGTVSGRFDSVLCCPGQVTHQTCTAQIFGTGNSPAYGNGPDWDPGFFKGVCPTGQYVAGVSRASTGGAVHGILCCNP